MLTRVGLSNGLGWDPSGTVMHDIDGPMHPVGAFEFAADVGVTGLPATLYRVS